MYEPYKKHHPQTLRLQGLRRTLVREKEREKRGGAARKEKEQSTSRILPKTGIILKKRGPGPGGNPIPEPDRGKADET